MTTLLTSFLFFAPYMVLVLILIGAPWSISDTRYQLDKIRKGLGWLFTAFCWGTAIPLVISWLDVSPEHLQFLAFLSAGGLMFTGAAPFFKEKTQGMVHYIGAGVCIAGALLWIILMGYWYIPTVLIVIAVLIAWEYSKWLFWIELAAFISMYTTLFILNLKDYSY